MDLDPEKYVGFQILEYALLSAPGAPLKQAVLDAGIGWLTDQVSALMETALRRAREEDSAGIWLGVWEHNYPAQAFYKTFGFSQVSAHTFVLGQDVQTDLIFYKKLP